MRYRKPKYTCLADTKGSVSVEWVVITGFVIALALSIVSAISPNAENTIPDLRGIVSGSQGF